MCVGGGGRLTFEGGLTEKVVLKSRPEGKKRVDRAVSGHRAFDAAGAANSRP